MQAAPNQPALTDTIKQQPHEALPNSIFLVSLVSDQYVQHLVVTLSPLSDLSDTVPLSIGQVRVNHGPMKPAILVLHPARFTNRLLKRVMTPWILIKHGDCEVV